MKNALLCLVLIGGVATAEPLSHSNNTSPISFVLNCHGCNPGEWVAALGLLFPDVAYVMGSDLIGMQVSLDCNPASVAQNHFAMFWAHLSWQLQQHEAGCWWAYDETLEVCAARADFCGSGGGEIWAGVDSVGMPGTAGSWYQECADAAQYERELCIANLP